jgi:predicted O-methyltransferase YrrM
MILFLPCGGAITNVVRAGMKEQIMRRILGLVILAGAVLLVAFQRPETGSYRSSPSLASNSAERAILSQLDIMAKIGGTYLSVPAADGKALRLLTEAADAQSVVEIGTSTGYSGLWFCLALRSTGGHLTTFEIDHGRAEAARENFEKAGAGKMVTVVEGDAHKEIVRLKAPIDIVFIDADKSGYVDYLSKLAPLVPPGGLILAHNVDMVPDYVKAVTTNRDLETIFYTEGAGLAVTLKKR